MPTATETTYPAGWLAINQAQSEANNPKDSLMRIMNALDRDGSAAARKQAIALGKIIGRLEAWQHNAKPGWH